MIIASLLLALDAPKFDPDQSNLEFCHIFEIYYGISPSQHPLCSLAHEREIRHGNSGFSSQAAPGPQTIDLLQFVVLTMPITVATNAAAWSNDND